LTSEATILKILLSINWSNFALFKQ